MAQGASLCGVGLAAALALGATGAAGAQEAAEPEALPSWERAAYKTLSFQALDNLADGALFAVIATATAGTSIVFIAANAATTAMLYYPYEVSWDLLGPPPSESSAETLAVKAVGYQVLTGTRKAALSYLLTGSLLPSVGFAAAAFAMDMTIYAGNDVAWDIFRPRAAPYAAEPVGTTQTGGNRR